MAVTSGGRAEVSFEDALTRNVRTLRGRLVAGALVALVTLTALALGLVWRQYEDAKREAARELRARAILAATVFDTYFAGQLAALSAIAASPTVMAGDTEAMTKYFAGFRPGKGSTFTAGVGWIDLDGRQRATSDPGGPIQASLADRTYFAKVVSTKKPFVSEAIVGGTTGRRLVVMAVPTRDEGGRITGVLAGGIVVQPSGDDARATDLGYAGLEVIDREGQRITRRNLARPRNAELVTQLRAAKEGVTVDTRGLDGSDGRVVAYASSAAPGWMTVLDQPTSTVFGDARRSLILEALLVGAAAALVLALIAWALRRARRDLRASRAQVGRWAQLTRSLNEAVDADGIRRVLAAALASEFPEASVVVALDRTGESEPPAVTVLRGRHSPFAGLDERVGLSIAEVVSGAGAPVALETQPELRTHTDLGAVLPVHARSLYGVSLVDERRVPVGAAALLFGVERALEGNELALVQAHADQVAHALARVRRHEKEHDVAVLLQQSLLPDELPETEGVEVAAYYRAGVANTTVGGDWYDVVRRPDGILHLTVGDVAGRGIAAAVSMGQLRHAFRAYALEHISPTAVVQRLARHVEEDGMATMVCVTYDPYTRELAYASAGHLPPLLVDPAAGTVTKLERPGSGPLGWLLPNTPEDERAIVPPDAMLALYTDGLVERRGLQLDQGIDRLGAAILAALPAEPRDAVDTVVDGVVESPTDDDLALLLVRLEEVPSALHIELPAEPSLLRELRRRVRTWLAHRGLDQSAREAAVLALSEACNNAIEHGYRDSPGTIRVRLDQRGDALGIRVADDGSWRHPVEDPTRGRGIVIMRGLMDVAEIVQKPHGTEVVLEQRL
ncbi:MAG: SpoIIE family protein phosphatase [Actinobacteria bacterium]|nr:SpoIIE family protein phosphatase [Actinomycetota bacterium]